MDVNDRVIVAAGIAAASLLCSGLAAGQGASPVELRRFIDQQVGGIQTLVVPADNAAIPLPKNPDGSVNPRFKTTEEKRYLGKLLFHDPVRAARVNQPGPAS
jgi:hypothetical protein